MRQLHIREPWADLAQRSENGMVETLVARIEILEAKLRDLESKLADTEVDRRERVTVGA